MLRGATYGEECILEFLIGQEDKNLEERRNEVPESGHCTGHTLISAGTLHSSRAVGTCPGGMQVGGAVICVNGTA